MGLRYRNKPGYVVEWTNYKSQDETLDTIEAIFLQVSRKEPYEKLVTIKLYITTLTLTVQGKYIKSWADTEFEILKNFVYANQNFSIQGYEEESKSDDIIETTEGNVSVFSPLNSDIESDDDSEIIEPIPMRQGEILSTVLDYEHKESDPEQAKVKTLIHSGQSEESC